MKNGQELKQLTLWSEEHLASLSVLPESEAESLTQEALSCMPIWELWGNINRDGSYGRTSPEYYLAAEALTSLNSYPVWKNAGMGGRTGCLTLNTSECHKDAVGSSLSDILVTGQTLPQRCFLSARACAGLLFRAKKIGKKLPARLEKALMEQAAGMSH